MEHFQLQESLILELCENVAVIKHIVSTQDNLFEKMEARCDKIESRLHEMQEEFNELRESHVSAQTELKTALKIAAVGSALIGTIATMCSSFFASFLQG